LKFLIGRGVKVRGSGAIEAATELKRGEDIVKLLNEAEQKESNIAEN
jgi:hypothetical protein